MAEFQEVLDNLSAEALASIFGRILPKENNKDLKNFINNNKSMRVLLGWLEEEKLEQLSGGNEEMKKELQITIRTIIFTIWEMYKTNKNLDFRKVVGL